MNAAPTGSNRTRSVLLNLASSIVVIAGLKAAAPLLVPFMISLFLAVLSLPAQAWLRRRGLPVGAAVGLLVLLNLALLTGGVALLSVSVAEFTEAAPRYQERLRELSLTARDWFEVRGIDLPDLQGDGELGAQSFIDLIGTTVRGLAATLSNIVLVILITAFLLLELAGLQSKMEAAGLGAESLERFETIRREVARYLGVKTLTSAATGLVVGLSLGLVGLDFYVLWGLLAFVLNYIPNLGSILAAIPATLFALVEADWGSAFLVALIYLLVNVVIGTVIEPTLMGRRFGLSTLVVFLALVFWGWVWGPVGMLLAVPLTMMAKILLENTPRARWIAILISAGPPPKRREPSA